MNSVIVGFGEIGKAVYEFINEPCIVEDLKLPTASDTVQEVDVLHICFPPGETFVQDVQEYIKKYNPVHVIVWSSTAIGTCSSIADWVVHSPVEGKHPELATSIREMPRWIGCFDKEHREWALEYFADKGLMTRPVVQSEFTEALKLLSTSEYGINIVFAGYKKWVAETLGMNYQLTKTWNQDYNYLYDKLGMHQFQKFVLEAPEGKIGGHCIRPNAELLNGQFPSELLRMIREYEG